MSRPNRREALLDRFRVAALERVAGMVETLGARGVEVELARVRADLHTLKGETRMLGLSSLASSFHAIEDWLDEAEPILREDPALLDRLGRVLELIRERLDAPLVEDAESELALAQAKRLLAGAEASPQPERAPQPEPNPTTRPKREGLALVDSATVDQICDRLEQLRGALGSLGARAKTREDRMISLADLDQLRLEFGELSELAWSLRMVVVEPALRELASHAEALALRLGKQVRVVVDAGGAELERSLLERLHEPLLHLVHNAIDHGIEAPAERIGKPAIAQLTITARSLGRELEFEVSDDGRGIDRERVRARAIERGLIDATAARGLGDEELLELLFMSGFSTAARVGEISGRGVGLDVVRRVIESLGGSVELHAQASDAMQQAHATLQSGTRFTLRVPATISRERVVVVALGHGLWGLPARRVGPILSLRHGSLLGQDPGNPTLILDGEHLPLLSLAGLLGIREPVRATIAIVCTRAGHRYALASPPLLGERELFRLPLGPTLASIGPASASAVMDDGRLVLLIEPAALLDLRQRLGRGEAKLANFNHANQAAPSRARPRVLVVDDSAVIRDLLVELLVSSQLEVESAEDGQAALDRLAQTRFDLVVTDVEMPRVDGFELLARIRERFGELPVIMSSTRSSPADRQRAVALGADAYFVKSESGGPSLIDAIQRFVEVPR